MILLIVVEKNEISVISTLENTKYICGHKPFIEWLHGFPFSTHFIMFSYPLMTPNLSPFQNFFFNKSLTIPYIFITFLFMGFCLFVLFLNEPILCLFNDSISLISFSVPLWQFWRNFLCSSSEFMCDILIFPELNHELNN